MSVYNETDAPLEPSLEKILEFDNIKGLDALKKPGFLNFVAEGMNLVDTLVKGDEFLEGDLEKAYEKSKVEKTDFVEPNSIEKAY